ncbi:MAG: hypothetical protein LBF64_06850 [Oscillospiraceae bacterium]|jgi:putative ABC transport system permease protein|nr:hypothetical protein [Oscillospiraceae bacterium]
MGKIILCHLSVLLIITAAAAFHVGVRAIVSGMTATGENYFAKTNFYDIKLVATTGFNSEDIEEISNVEGVRDITAVHSTDVLVEIENGRAAFEVLSTADPSANPSGARVNVPQITSGRYPAQSNECLVDARYTDSQWFPIGERIQLIATAGAQGSPVYDEYIVSGYAQTPIYISEDRGTTKIGDGKLYGFILVPESSWKAEHFTEIYLTVQNSRDTNPFDSSYGQKIEVISERIRALGETRAAVWYTGVSAEAKAAIAAAEKEISDSRAALAQAQKDVEKAEQEAANGGKAPGQDPGALEEETSEREDTTPIGASELTAAGAALNREKSQIDAQEAAMAHDREALDAAKAEWQRAREQYAQRETALARLEEQADRLEEELEEQFKYMEYRQIELFDLQKSLGKKTAILMDQTIPDLEEEIASLSGEIAEIESEMSDYAAATAQYDALRREHREGSEALWALGQEMAQSEADIQAREKTLTENQAALEQAKRAYQIGLSDYQTQASALSQTQQPVSPTQRPAAPAAEVPQRPDTAGENLETLRAALRAESLQAEKVILAAEDTIAQAEKRLAALESSKWYVLNASINPGFSTYKARVQRMRSVDSLLPILFFLAAALTSLIAMSRLARYRRGGMGFLRAPGDSRRRILLRYMIHFSPAGILGCAIGLVTGFSLLPQWVFRSYETLYTALPPIEIHFDAWHALMAVLLAVVSTALASVLVCLRELKSNPHI